MASIKWCLKQKDGIKLIEPNDNLAKGYMKMAENSIGTMDRERKYNIQFSISACYYSMYYSLYAVMMKFGVKCEIHSCTIRFMKRFLADYYSSEDIKIIKKAFDLRNISQYYVDKIVSEIDTNMIIKKAPVFYNKSKEILIKLNEDDIKDINKEVGEFY